MVAHIWPPPVLQLSAILWLEIESDMKPSETQHGSIALNFVRALVNGDLIKAREFLSESVQDDIQKELNEMIEYGDGPVDHIEVMNEMTSWPQMNSEDIGWAYVAMSGPGFSEAVTVVISKVNDVSRITSIEWGRP